MSWPERTGRLNDRAELLLLIALALDIPPDARRLLRAVSLRVPLPVSPLHREPHGPPGKELETFTREIEDDAPLVHFDLIEVQAGPDVRDVPAPLVWDPDSPTTSPPLCNPRGHELSARAPAGSGPCPRRRHTLLVGGRDQLVGPMVRAPVGRGLPEMRSCSTRRSTSAPQRKSSGA